MCESERLVFFLHPVFEVSGEFVFRLQGERVYSILIFEHVSADGGEFLVSRRRQDELVLEPVAYRRVVGEEVFKSFCKSGDNHDRVVVPVVHFHEKLVERIHLVGISVRQ